MDTTISIEYYNSFDKFNKKFNTNTVEGLENHIYRNKNQFKKAPKDLKTMEQFVKLGYFYREGYSPCHNIPSEIQNVKEYRKQTFKEMITLLKERKLQFPNQFSFCKNISFRAIPNTDFEGCQFVYNADTGKLVTDCINRGTWDFGKPGTMAHMLLDFMPWVNYGNGENTETEKDFLMSKSDENKYLHQTNVKSNNIIVMEEDHKFLKDFYDKQVANI